MMCAFMTPVVKSDWEIFDSKHTTKGKKSSGTSSPKISTVASAPELMTREQKLQRIKQIQETRRQLLEGRPRKGSSPQLVNEKGFHRSGAKSCGVSASNSKNHLPISPLALEENNHKAKGSNSSLNKFHTKVLDRIKEAFSSSRSSSKEDLGPSSPEQQRRQDEGEVAAAITPQQLARRRGSRSRVSSGTSFDIPRITEEEIDASGTVICNS